MGRRLPRGPSRSYVRSRRLDCADAALGAGRETRVLAVDQAYMVGSGPTACTAKRPESMTSVLTERLEHAAGKAKNASATVEESVRNRSAREDRSLIEE